MIPNFSGLLDSYYKYRNIQFHKANQPKLINQYLNNHTTYMLQIGCQGQIMEDWLNVDLVPKSREVVLMDATKAFPFNNDIFTYIFSEHMIEHITYNEAEFMLKECHRVMKSAGIIRISTPNMKFLIDLYQESKTDFQKDYIQHSWKFIKGKMPLTTTSVINNFFKDWGHQYIHDFDSLDRLLTNAGFRNVNRVEVGKSNYQALKNLEKHGDVIGEEFNKLESIVVEATK